MISVLLLLLGFVLLIGGAHLLVGMCVLVARRLHVPPVVIGMTVVAFGTSLPEFIVGLSASVTGENVLVFGNVVGSNILNVLVMLGLCACIYPCVVSRQGLMVDIPLAILAALMMLVFSFFAMPLEQNSSMPHVLYFSRFDGILLLAVFVFFIVYTAYGFKRRRETHDVLKHEETKRVSVVYNILGLVGGLVALISGGRIIVFSTVELATLWGVSTRIISIVVVALGTSLPELAVSVASAYKKHSDLAFGNIVGSNIFNVFFIFGTCVLISPIEVDKGALVDLLVHVFSVVLLGLVVFLNKARTISRPAGAVFLLLYALYMGQLFIV